MRKLAPLTTWNQGKTDHFTLKSHPKANRIKYFFWLWYLTFLYLILGKYITIYGVCLYIQFSLRANYSSIKELSYKYKCFFSES